MRCLLASRNPGKLGEIRHALSHLGMEFVLATEWPDLPAPEETGSTFAENARLKALYYHRKTGLAALADDSGLVVEALGGAPGVQSARFAASDELRIARLLRELAETGSGEPWPAHFVCAVCLCLPNERLVESQGEVHGLIVSTPSGSGGFGYDPVFFYPPRKQTFAEMSRDQKNRISHRAQALEKLERRLAEQGIL